MANKLVILGAGESGLGAALLGKKNGWDVFVSDAGVIRPIFRNELTENEIHFEENQHSDNIILNADCIIISPGIPKYISVVSEILKKGIPLLSEIEFAFKYTSAKIIAITGSNGKTTSTFLTYEILKNAGLNVCIAGNMGKSFARKVAYEKPNYFVLEVSSFQLDDIYDFKADISVLLNITPDHLDRYDNDFEKYANSKFRITNNQTSKDFFIYNKDDVLIDNHVKQHEIPSQLIPFSQHQKLKQGVYKQDRSIITKDINKKLKINIDNMNIQGKHNVYNSMAAAAVAHVLDIDDKIIRKSFTAFKGLDHRLEKVLKIRDVLYINDSKATNVNSVWYALECMGNPTIWIAGGIDKGNDYEILKNLVSEKVKAIVCLTKDSKPIHNAFKGLADIIVDTESMEEAVKTAYELANKGDTVLLSPACASFDLFENYEDRGNQFKNEVRKL